MLEEELSCDKILNGKLIGAALYLIVAEHVECSFVEIGSTKHTVPVQRYVVAALAVHDNAQRGITAGVDEEINTQVGGGVVVLGENVLISGLHTDVLRHHRGIVPSNESLVAECFGTGCIVGEHGVGVGGSINVDNHLAAASCNTTGPCSVNCSTECVVAKIFMVVDKHIVGVYIEVECEVFQVMMVYRAIYNCYTAARV